MKQSKRKLYRAVIDTNILVSGFISKSSLPYHIVSKLRENAFELVVTDELWSEYEEVLSRSKLIKWLNVSEEEIVATLRRIQRGATIVISSTNFSIEIRDPKDKKVLAAALGGKADYLVTGDEDLLTLKENPKLGNLKIVTTGEFVKLV